MVQRLKLIDQPLRVRHELKYIIPSDKAEEIRNYIQIVCDPDPFAKGDPPIYKVSTMQLDSPNLALHLAKDRKQKTRFKLRVRTYDYDSNGTVFFEVKRKEDRFIRKTRSRVPIQDYSERLFEKPFVIPHFRDDDEYLNHYEFLRLMKMADARPMVHIQYERESWIGQSNPDIRITMDRNIRYRRAEGYKLFDGNEKGWRAMDSETALRRSFGGVILEIKSPGYISSWIFSLVRNFDLQRTGFCKYSTAMRLESLFSGQTYTVGSERCNY
ncbi:MAG: polyphosphate polymerase domain-containing protein [Verrucomicrobia bacterium]|nr:polyphosphate polymerase domain-containing protein [Verrucomicrobiota bacterium]MDA1067112.1 polyphosphate polymerase domain-containing protein [Verrucomicrobiota bacterium]